MTEHAPRQEQQTNRERLANHEHREHEARLHEKLQHEAAKARETGEHVPELAQKAKEEALPAEQTRVSETKGAEPSSQYVGRELKSLTFQRTLSRVRHRLSAPDKALSKVVHQPVVDAISQVGEKTVARPSGLLGGSLFAFLGSCLFLWASKHYGFRYNYFLFFIFFVGGFGVGLVLELLVHLARRRQVS